MPPPSISPSYAVSATRFILRWTTRHAVSFTVDGMPLPLTGQASFALQTRTFVLVATGPIHNEAVRNVYLAVVSPCAIQVDGQRFAVPSTACMASPTATTIPPTPTPPPTAPPTSTVPAAADTATPGAAITPAPTAAIAPQ